MRRVGGQEEHFALADGDVAGGGSGAGSAVDDFERHAAAVLVEAFGGGVDVVVCAGIEAADDLVGVEGGWWVRGNAGFVSENWGPCLEEEGGKDGEKSEGRSDHDCKVLIIDAVVADGWLQEMGILFEPGLFVSALEVLGGGRSRGFGEGIHTILVGLEVMGALLDCE